MLYSAERWRPRLHSSEIALLDCRHPAIERFPFQFVPSPANPSVETEHWDDQVVLLPGVVESTFCIPAESVASMDSVLKNPCLALIAVIISLAVLSG